MKLSGFLFFFSTIALAVFGIALRMRIHPGSADGPALVAGAAAFIVFAFFFARRKCALAIKARWLFYLAALGIVLAMAFAGRSFRGGTFIAGGMNPTEPVKPLFAVFAAAVFARALEKEGKVSVKHIIAVALALAPLAGCMVRIGDLGLLALTALSLLCIIFAASFVWGAAGFAAAGAAAAYILSHPFGHLISRVSIWRNPFADPTGKGWQTCRALSAMFAGGLYGSGWGAGDPSAIPMAESDFIYALISQELGMTGASILFGIYAIQICAGFAIAMRLEKPQAIIASALVTTLGIQVLVNTAGVVNAIPMTGITLPLVSHGGSSLATVLATCGMILSFAICGSSGKTSLSCFVPAASLKKFNYLPGCQRLHKATL